jgi:hypothetical protein
VQFTPGGDDDCSSGAKGTGPCTIRGVSSFGARPTPNHETRIQCPSTRPGTGLGEPECHLVIQPIQRSSARPSPCAVLDQSLMRLRRRFPAGRDGPHRVRGGRRRLEEPEPALSPWHLPAWNPKPPPQATRESRHPPADLLLFDLKAERHHGPSKHEDLMSRRRCFGVSCCQGGA